MKHLLIILSFLLLSSPVIGDNHKGETLYLWENSSGYVWKTFGDGKVQPKYKGEIKNRKPNGQGTLTTPNKGNYVGEWKDGRWDGQGTYNFPDGEKYVGEYKDGKTHGQGTYTYPDGRKYVGEFKNGDRWNGTFTTTDGRKYVGEWKDD